MPGERRTQTPPGRRRGRGSQEGGTLNSEQHSGVDGRWAKAQTGTLPHTGNASTARPVGPAPEREVQSSGRRSGTIVTSGEGRLLK